MKSKTFVILAVIMGIFFSASPLYAEWNFGIGTGFFFLNAEGEVGFHTKIAGPVKIEFDLDPDDFSDAAESAIGLGGYATDGTWLIRYAFGMLKLGGDARRTFSNGTTIATELDYDITSGELIVGYPLLAGDGFILRAEGGVRYIRHDIDLDLAVNETELDRGIDEDWTDFLLGLSLSMPFAGNWSWDSHVNAGFGGTEGTYKAHTGVSWQFLPHWSTTLYGNYAAVEFENGSRGDSDWYLYDVDEYGVGISVLYNW